MAVKSVDNNRKPEPWASLIPMDEDVCKQHVNFRMCNQHVWVGRSEQHTDVNISCDVFGVRAIIVHSMHLQIRAERTWLQSVWSTDWRDKTAALHHQLASHPLASACVLQPGTGIWVSRYIEKTGVSQFKSYNAAHGPFDLFHGDALHFVPPRVTYRLSFMLRIETSRLMGWMDAADDECEQWWEEHNQMVRQPTIVQMKHIPDAPLEK